MNIELSAEATEYGRQARRAFEAAGGAALLESAEREPDRRAELLAPVFGALAAWDLRPRKDPDELEAAAALCRAAGYWGVPYPVAERLSRPTDSEFDGLVIVDDTTPSAAVAGLDLRWAAMTLDGRRSSAERAEPSLAPRLGAFVTPLKLRPIDAGDVTDIALALVLPCWTLLGMLDRAIALATAHVSVREQFGQPLARLQGVQFQLTDAEVERGGVDVLASYALWSVQTERAEAIDDALALRLAAVEAAEVVFRVAHQLHGALGFCDESPLSWLSRYSLPLRRLPFGISGSRAELTKRVGRHGLTGLFGPVGESVTP
ncbi:acyl-CoA dehydrogenase family protein [Nocardia callitridis]|uniref:Acyl-CoA dehydrogenase family protein n=1 Tax=Nocardia callitridis TaxID=648753 RepID=A0ABP9KPJ2_9NOCA